jgi:ubiquinone/menaquinone biosynthesis C-methylase UbiE
MEQDKDGLAVSKILEFAELADKDILEIGCGDGRITSKIVGSQKSLMAIDTDADSIKKAEAHVTGVSFMVCSGEALCFTDGSFDLIVFTLSLHHQNSRQALSEAERVLKRDGRVLVLEPVADSEIEKICNLLDDETTELSLAQIAIENSEFKFTRKEIFQPEWQFGNREEFMAWLFNYYRRPFDRQLAKQVDVILGEKVHAQPLIIQDGLMIASLRK